MNGAELGLEANNNHDASPGTNDGDGHTPDGPLAAEHEANEEEDEQDTACKLEVHLSVLLVELGQASKSLGLTDPGVRKHHQKTADNRKIAEEEVEVEDEAVSKGLGHNNAHETSHGVVRVFSDDDKDRACTHDNNVAEQEEVRDAGGNCNRFQARLAHARIGLLRHVRGRVCHTVSVIP